MAERATTSDVYVILSGFVRVLNNTASGETAMIAIRTRGDLVGELAAMDGKPRTSTIIAASRTRVRVVDAPLFRTFASTNPAVGDAVARSVVGKLRAATRFRADTGQASVLTRVARVLEHLVEGYGRPVGPGLLIDVPLPRQDLASLVGASEKGVARAYVRLRAAGVIDAGYRRTYVLDIEALARFADGTG